MVTVEGQGDSIVLSGEIEALIEYDPCLRSINGAQLLAFSDGTLIRAVRSGAESWLFTPICKGRGSAEWYEAGEAGEGLELNSVPYQWAMSGGTVYHSLL